MQTQDHNSTLRNFAALVDFSNLVNSSLDLNFALSNILLTCFGKFHTSKGLIALFNEDGYLEVSASKGISPTILEKFPCINLSEYNQSDVLINFIREIDFPLYQEIRSFEVLNGILILGPRLTKRKYEQEDIDFLKTILNVGATAIENSLIVDKLKNVNRNLDNKVNQLSSLFDLSKEFSGILNEEKVSKLLVFSLIGQMLVSKYSVIICSNGSFSFLENRFDEKRLSSALKDCNAQTIVSVINRNELSANYKAFSDLGVDLIIPMQIKGETKGLILLGRRKNDLSFSKSDIEFVSSVGSLAIISIENSRLFKETLEKQRLEKDLEIARNIQQNLLPKKVPSLSNLEVSAFNSSAKIVGGDYYDIIKLSDTEILVAVADVSGKGVQAALLMANLQAFLKSIVKQRLPLVDASNLINDLVSENTSMGSFITFFWGIFNNERMEFTYVNAGHNPPLHITKRSINKLKKGGMILGFLPTTIPYTSETVKMNSGDAIILFTDGITEAMNIKGEEYTDERFEQLILNISIEKCDKILEEIKIDVGKFTQGAEQSDDITCLVLKVK